MCGSNVAEREAAHGTSGPKCAKHSQDRDQKNTQPNQDTACTLASAMALFAADARGDAPGRSCVACNWAPARGPRPEWHQCSGTRKRESKKAMRHAPYARSAAAVGCKKRVHVLVSHIVTRGLGSQSSRSRPRSTCCFFNSSLHLCSIARLRVALFEL